MFFQACNEKSKIKPKPFPERILFNFISLILSLRVDCYFFVLFCFVFYEENLSGDKGL